MNHKPDKLVQNKGGLGVRGQGGMWRALPNCLHGKCKMNQGTLSVW